MLHSQPAKQKSIVKMRLLKIYLFITLKEKKAPEQQLS